MLVDETLYISHNLCIAVVSPISYSGETNTVLLVGHRWLRVQDEGTCKQPLDGVSLKVLQYKQYRLYLDPFYLIKNVSRFAFSSLGLH